MTDKGESAPHLYSMHHHLSSPLLRQRIDRGITANFKQHYRWLVLGHMQMGVID